MALARSLSPSVTNHVLLAQMGDFEDLEHAVRYTAPVLRNKRQSTSHPLRLLIIDSIAAPLRSEYASSSNALAQRGKDLSAFAYRLRSLAAELDLVLVVINQVSDSYDDQELLLMRTRAHGMMSPMSIQRAGVRVSVRRG
jgi:RecA/RadA recombinase